MTQIPSSKWTFIAQIHGFNETADPLLKLRYDNRVVEALAKQGVNATNNTTFPLATVDLGDVIAYQIKMNNGLLSVTVKSFERPPFSMSLNSNPNDERRNPKEYRNPNDERAIAH